MRTTLIVTSLLTVLLAGSASGWAAAATDEVIPDDIARFPDRPLVHALYAFPAGWEPDATPRQSGYPRAAVADFNGDGVTDVASVLVSPARNLYAVVVWSGRKMDKTYTYRDPTFVFRRPLTPRINVEFVQQGPDLRMRVSEEDAVEVFRWSGRRFAALGPAKSVKGGVDYGFPAIELHPRYTYPAGWAPYPGYRSDDLPLDNDSSWDRVEAVINASWKRYGVIVWLSDGAVSTALYRPILLFEAPIKPDTDVRVAGIENSKAFSVRVSKDAAPETFVWNGQTIVSVKK